MRITRHTIPTCIVALLFIALGVQSDPSLYSQTWHRHHLGSPIFALPWYEDRVSRSRTLLAMGQSRGWSLLSEDRNRRRSRNSPPSRSFDRMKTSEKVVYGTIRVLADTIEDYIVGFVIGLTIGAVLTLPKVILRSSGERVGNELGTRSLAWAQQTGEFLGSFRGCATAVRLIRSPKRDNWNIVYGCATAGAFIGRNRKYFRFPCFSGLQENSKWNLDFC